MESDHSSGLAMIVFVVTRERVADGFSALAARSACLFAAAAMASFNDVRDQSRGTGMVVQLVLSRITALAMITSHQTGLYLTARATVAMVITISQNAFPWLCNHSQSAGQKMAIDRKSTRLNSSHMSISY